MMYVHLIALFTGTVMAQLSRLPPCSMPCLSKGLRAGHCSFFVSECTCLNANTIAQTIAACLKGPEGCPNLAEDSARFFSVYRETCNKYGIPINVSGTSPADELAKVRGDGVFDESAHIEEAHDLSDAAISNNEHHVREVAHTCAAATTTTWTQTITITSKVVVSSASASENPPLATVVIPSNSASLNTNLASSLDVGSSQASTSSDSSTVNNTPDATHTAHPTTVTTSAATTNTSSPPSFTAAGDVMKVPAAMAGILGLVMFAL
ncbi:hypothetical protein ACN47E_008659 [Coniothyrium glycines]